MERCTILDPMHQIGAPPRGWGLRRRNLKVSDVNVEDSGVRCQKKETEKLKRVGAKLKSRLKRSGSGEHCLPRRSP
jgi:hypothetical protein